MSTILQRDDESRPEYLARIFRGKTYTIDGDHMLDMVDFCLMNEIETPHAVELATMAPESVTTWSTGRCTYVLARLA